MLVDLHMHTTYSDGENDPLKLVDICREQGVCYMAIADHNEIKGVREAIENNPYNDITIFSAIELSAKAPGRTQKHILGYNIDLENVDLNSAILGMKKSSIEKLKSNLYFIKKDYGIVFDDEALEKMFNRKGNVGRPELAKLFIEYGYATEIQEAFDKFLNPIKPKIPDRKFELTDKECIELILNAGGIPCLAHPMSLRLNEDDLKTYIRSLKTYGLAAVEVYHSDCPEHLRVKFSELARKFELLESVGSDYHGPVVSPGILPGKGNNNLNKTYVSLLTRLIEVNRYGKKN